MLYLEFNNHKYEAELADTVSEGTYQFIGYVISECKRLGGRIKMRNYANNTTLHCWHNQDIDAVLSFETTESGEVINRYAVLNISRNY